MPPSTKGSAPTPGVDKNLFVRQILHVLKDSDLSLNMWFRRRNMGYAKSLKEKIWTHEGPSTKRKKNDEHMKAHVLRKKRKEIAMFSK